MRANVQQVAERAKVSRMTVSRVLQNRRHEVSDETYERVVAALRELDYVPVKTAFQNHHTKTHVVGIVPHSSNLYGYPLDLQTLGAICSRAVHYGYDAMIAQRGESEWMAGREELRFLDRRTDGFIFISTGMQEWNQVIERLTHHKVPLVVCYRRDVPEGVAWVDPDNDDIVDQAMTCLIQAGHSKIAYMAVPPNRSHERQLLANMSGDRQNYDDQQRRRRYLERMRQNGHPAAEKWIFSVADSSYAMTAAEAKAVVDSGATAVVTFCSILGFQLLDHLKAMGLRVPEDFSIVSFDWQAESLRRGITHVTFGVDTVGEYAMDAWIALTQGCPSSACNRIVPVKLVAGRTVAPPPPG